MTTMLVLPATTADLLNTKPPSFVRPRLDSASGNGLRNRHARRRALLLMVAAVGLYLLYPLIRLPHRLELFRQASRAIAHRRDVSHADEIFMYLVTREDRVKALLASEMSHRRVGSTRPRGVYIPESLHPKTVELLELFDLQVFYAPPFSPDDYVSLTSTANQKWLTTPLKFHLFNSTATRVVALDVDMLIRRSIDDLFDKTKYPLPFYGARDDFLCGDGPDWKVNGGVQVMTQNPAITEGLFGLLSDPARRFVQADQDILTEYWGKNAAGQPYILPSEYMAFPDRCKCEAPRQWDDATNRIIHFSWHLSYTGQQEWDQNYTSPEFQECYGPFLREYREMYHEAEAYVTDRAPHLYSHLRNIEGIST